MREKVLKLQKGIEILKSVINNLKETLHNLQNIVFNSKIISFSHWKEFNRIEFDLIEPHINLKYDTKGTEGICGFKLKEVDGTFKIVKIKIEYDSDS